MGDVYKTAGIVTYAHCENYGADLQTCALGELIGHVSNGKIIAETIWFDRPSLTRQEILRILFQGVGKRLRGNFFCGTLEVLRLLVKILKGKLIKPDDEVLDLLARRREAFEDFWEMFIRHSPKVSVSEIGRLPYDILIAGSDQIWNWRLTGDLLPFFLLFNPPSKASRHIAYAASVGVESIDRRYEDVYRRGLDSLDAISVRELQGKKLLSRLTNKNIEVVLDPTLLLTDSDWLKFERSDCHVDGRYVLVYNLNSSRRFWNRVVSFAQKNDLKIVNLYGTSLAPKSVAAVEIMTAGPSDFLYLLRHAQVVVTNSFHGTVFSINFKVPFVSVLNPASMVNTRIESIASLLGLMDRVVYDDECTDFPSISGIDYKSVHQRLNDLRQLSLKFLRESIDG